jgi:hypothetical protein
LETLQEKVIPVLRYEFGRIRFLTNSARIVLTATSSDGTVVKLK